ncbi:hypothetical protein [uncultured Ruegeria sp.]|uniref:beta strand repeat-containing protein n=1 Tax=uncultured Ruegeria sp. TaxID=259304 RepID=UPI00262F811F|nr:hypothetical protein [uncultured Ruegeria sp.]
MSIFGFFLRSFQGRQRTVIEDGTDESVSSKFDGQRFVLNKGDTALVEGAPVLDIVDDRVSFRNAGTAASDDSSTISVEGDKVTVNNRKHGEIRADEANTAVDISGAHTNIRNSGLIDGGNTGVSFANGGESSGRLTNHGTVQSDSRAVNIGGDGIKVENYGKIQGTGDQRNGTIYSDGSADNFSIWNGRNAEIDAGEGNNGAGIALQTGSFDGDVVTASISNRGTIQGRGQADASSGLAGDGIRLFSGAEGGGTTFKGNIYNSGKILSESGVGPTSAVRISDGLSFDGTIVNGRRGLIDGANNGLYFGDAAHDATVKNYGVIQSGSRAVNIDGTGVDLHNFGSILGTDNQRNGTVYSDATADDYNIVNYRRGVIDAGEGNEGVGISLQTGSFAGDVVNASITNYGTIFGRGSSGEGILVFSGADEGTTTFKGDIVNTGNIEANLGGVEIGRDVEVVGDIINRGNIGSENFAGVQVLGLLDGNFENSGEITGGDGIGVSLDVLEGNFTNYGLITASSDGVSIDEGTGDINNHGTITSTGENALNISGGGTLTGNINNYGAISGVLSDGISINSNNVLDGNINNYETITGEQIGLDINGRVTGAINNLATGTITGGEASIDAASRIVVNNEGTLNGNVLLSQENDVFNGANGTVNGEVHGNGGEDLIVLGDGSDILDGGTGNDDLTGGGGADTFVFRLGTNEDTVRDFQNGFDLLDVSDFFTDGAEAAAAARQDGADTVIDLDLETGDLVRLADISVSQIDEADFLF